MAFCSGGPSSWRAILRKNQWYFNNLGFVLGGQVSLVWSLVPFLNERWCMKSRSVHEQTRPAGSTAARLGAARGGDDPKLADLHQQFALGPCHFRGPWRRARIVHISTPLWRRHRCLRSVALRGSSRCLRNHDATKPKQVAISPRHGTVSPRLRYQEEISTSQK